MNHRSQPHVIGLHLQLLFLLAGSSLGAATPDWLIDPAPFKARVTVSADGRDVALENGLVRRIIRIEPNAATIAYDNLVTGESMIRSVRPEAQVEIDGTAYDVGGLTGQPVHNYLDAAWVDKLEAPPGAFRFTRFTTGQTKQRFPWKKRLEWMPQDLPWPAPGVSLTLEFAAPTNSAVAIDVHYELFDGLPLLSKWIVVRNASDKPVRLNRFISEILAAVEPESIVDDSPTWQLPHLMVETDYTFGGMSGPNHSAGVFWVPDPLYGSQVNYNRLTPCLLECRPPLGPDQVIAPGSSLESFRAFELAQDTTERERKTLAVRRMYRTVAPWVTENPVLMHIRSAQPDAVKLAIDQCADVGFELAVLTFGSGFNFESRDPDYQVRIKELVDYGRARGVALGGYSLLASRGAGTDADNTQGVPARFGVMPCLGATWGSNYLAQLQHLMRFAGLGVLEHDGSYPGDQCASTNHPFHRGLADSQWVQWKAITGLYQWCRSQGVYLNIPDWYFLNGGSKTGMGYREVNWSLPRAYQEIIERQNIFDGTWDKTPSMGWMFVPLTEYHGGGAAATIEPLKDHLEHYEQRLANLFGAGVIACYRGPRLYDTDDTKAVVKRWVDFYKRHRPILNSDIIHLRRADGRDLDYILHVNPALKEKGLLMVYNPLDRVVAKTLTIPLYYTGLTDRAAVREQDNPARTFALDRPYAIALPVQVPARGVTWFVIEKTSNGVASK
ncbi:MAG TPA: hypothetical protein PKM43_22185 [Verrucomicrobiota bacterium]|nr:hypothetical protein [Verrucomicrobiota bacterium]HRZ35248.1 hypothetical protein [Candidatus Paceibacterota bacterium]HRZ56688.1 hypothetical protein [Candidatus Paceibacterota bacterium]